MIYEKSTVKCDRHGSACLYPESFCMCTDAAITYE